LIANGHHSRSVHQVLATLGYGDAIGHEVLGIQRVLRGAGYSSEIFVETADPRLEELTQDYRDLPDCSSPENLLIHHFSIGSRASRVAYALPDRMMLVYHNITPPEYFLDAHRRLVRLCYMGRRELKAYAERCDLAVGDSEYNRQELEALGFPQTGVLPVVPDFSHLDNAHPDFAVAGEFDDEWTNVLFVGRVIPNKRIEDLIGFFHVYRTRFNPRSRLLIVGSYGGFERYLAMLHHMVAAWQVPDVHFVGHVSNEELAAYYQVADLFLCASRHEGFCVPLVEAFHHGIPVVARAATAVPSTMDGGGVLYSGEDAWHVAALMDAVVSERELSERILERQDRALERLLRKDFRGTLLGFVDRVFASPRLPPVEVAWDFWHQFSAMEQLAELREYRPGAYRALPSRETVLADEGE
jgi:L-malate glycosyltransferase